MNDSIITAILVGFCILGGIYFVCWAVDTVIEAVRRHRGEKGVVLTGDEADALLEHLSGIRDLLHDRFTLAEQDSENLSKIRDAVDAIDYSRHVD